MLLSCHLRLIKFRFKRAISEAYWQPAYVRHILTKQKLIKDKTYVYRGIELIYFLCLGRKFL